MPATEISYVVSSISLRVPVGRKMLFRRSKVIKGVVVAVCSSNSDVCFVAADASMGGVGADGVDSNVGWAFLSAYSVMLLRCWVFPLCSLFF